MSDLIFPNWRNGNQRINYPFADGATLINTAGVRISRDLFDDARIHPLGGGADAYLGRINNVGNLLTFGISDFTGELATGTFERDAAANEVQLVDRYLRPAGILVSSADRLQGLFSLLEQGDTLFTAAETGFVASVVVPMPQHGVQGVVLDDGTFIAGDLYLCGTDGVVLSVTNEGLIRVDIVGDPYAVLKECAQNGTPLPSFCGLRTINNIHPDARGDFKLFQGANQAVDNILRVVPVANGLRLVALGNKVFNGRA